MRKSLILFWLILIGGCHSKSHSDYPGFTYVGAANKANYFIDQKTVVPAEKLHAVVVSQLIENPDKTHSIGNILINCSNKTTFAEEYSVFDLSGRFVKSSKELVTDENTVISYVCEREKSIPLITGEFVESTAVARILGSSGWRWSPTIPASLNFISTKKDQIFKAVAILDKEVVESGQTRRLLVLASVPEDPDYSCHACSTLISAFVMKRTDAGWFMESENPYLAVSGAFATPPEASLIKLGPNHTGFDLKSSAEHQGFEETSVEYFAPIGEGVFSLLSVETESSYTGSLFPQDVMSQTTTKWGPQTTEGYYDISLSTKGTKLNDMSQPVSADEEKHCKMKSVKYICE